MCGTRCVIIDIRAWSFTQVNSLRPQSQCLAKAAFCKAPQKNKFYLFFWRPPSGLYKSIILSVMGNVFSLSITFFKIIVSCRLFGIGDHCIIRHSLRYFRHSGLVIYTSKLPAPSVSMPCDYPILQSPTKEQVKLVFLKTSRRSSLVLSLTNNEENSLFWRPVRWSPFNY